MAYSMAKTETYIRKISGFRVLKIDPGRYLAINEEGEYVISTKCQPIRGRPYGEGLRTPLVLGGAPPPLGNPKYRVFVIDAGETFDFVVVGTLAVHDSWIWVAGDTIRHEDEECNSKFVGYLSLMVSKLLVSKFPKENPQKMSANQIRVEVKKQTFNKMFADIGIEASKTDNAQVRFDKMFADIGMEQIFLKLFAGIGIADPVESLDEVQAVDRAEVTIGKSDIRIISSIADELKASYDDLEEWKATMKEREASVNLIMGKSSLADEFEAQKEDEKWAEQTVLDRAIDIEEIIADMEAYQRLGKSGIADEVEAQKEEEEWEELQAVERAKVEGISANMSIDRKRVVSEVAPDIDIDNKKQKLQEKEEKEEKEEKKLKLQGKEEK